MLSSPTLPAPTTPAKVQLINWILRPIDYLETNYQRYGDCYCNDFGSQYQWVFFNHPEAVQTLFTQDGSSFSAPGEANAILKPLLGENSLILLSGASHRRHRQLLMPPLHGERLKAYCDLIGQITDSVMAEIPAGSEFRAREAMQKISMRVILQAVFGVTDGERYRQLEERLRDRIEMTGNPLRAMLLFFPLLARDYGPWSPGAKSQKLAAEIDELIFAEICDRRAAPDPSRADILSLLLSAQDENGHGLSDQELRDELMTMLVAGHETTATALAWSLYWLHYYPAMKERLVAELSETASAELIRLPYLTALCQETLRIYPVALVTFPRQVERPVEVMGHPLQPGTTVVGNIYSIHRRPEIYPEPDSFRPERFLERQFSPYEYLPFGGGSRRCIGAALALFEMKLVLGTVMARYDLALAETQPVQPQRRGVTISPAGGVKLQMLGPRTA